MCYYIAVSESHKAIGVFRKGNEPEDMRMAIIIAPCRCGQKHFARIDGGRTWAEATPVPTEAPAAIVAPSPGAAPVPIDAAKA